MFQFAHLINFSIRGLTLFGKFVLFFFMAKYLSPNELGVYGIFVSIIIFAVYVVGLDFYTYSTRELITLDRKKWGGAIKSQIFLLSFTYSIGLPLLIYISAFFLPQEWLMFLAILIFLEHVNQEIMRLLIADGKALFANNLFFVRSGLWCYLVITLMGLSIIEHKLENIFIAWILVSVIVLIVGGYSIIRSIDFNHGKISYSWIKKGIKVSFLFLVATLLVRCIMTLDKLWLQYVEGVDKVAVYALFFSITSVLLAVLEASCFSFLYPKMIQNRENKALFLDVAYKMLYGTVAIIAFLSIFLIVLLPYFLTWVDKEIYVEYRYVFYVLLLANSIYGFSMIAHYMLYTYREDRKILYSQLLSFIVFIVSTWLLVSYGVEISVAYSLLLSFATILIVKSYYAFKLLKQ